MYFIKLRLYHFPCLRADCWMCFACIVIAQSQATTSPMSARSSGKISIGFSIAGIVVGVLLIVTLIVVYLVVGFTVAGAVADKIDKVMGKYQLRKYLSEMILLLLLMMMIIIILLFPH